MRPNPGHTARVPVTITQTSSIAFRSRRAQDIHSPIEEAHISTTLVHLANASYRLGRTLQFDSAQEQVIGDEEANRLLRASYRAPLYCAGKDLTWTSAVCFILVAAPDFLTSSHDFDRCRTVLLAHKPNDSELIHYRGNSATLYYYTRIASLGENQNSNYSSFLLKT